MANGPPTPPPTTDTEIQDETRTVDPAPTPVPANTAPPQPAQPQPQPVHLQDPYQLIFPRIAELAAAKQWLELIDTSEITEINATNDQQLSRLFVIVPLVLAYLIQNEISIAKLVLERVQSNIRSNPLLKAVRSLTVAYGAGAYEEIYSKAAALTDLVAQSNFAEPQLAQVVKGMVDCFLASFRDRTFLLLSRAYTSMPLDLAEMYFGMPADSIIAASQGWIYDASSKILRPVATKERISAVGPAASSLEDFAFIAQSVSRLEM